MPLVWISDCHSIIGHPELAQKYILLTLIEDSIRENGKIIPNNGGLYHRFCAQHGFTHDSFIKLSKLAFDEYMTNEALGIFPEWILHKIQGQYLPTYPSLKEADLFKINPVFSEFLLGKTSNISGKKTDGAFLEHLASYLLSAIPGFEIELKKQTKDYHFDGFIRNRGPKEDFRSDLGNYILVECKDWGNPVGVDAISYFAHKLQLHDCRAGILFSNKGITGTKESQENDRRYGELTLLKSYHHAGRIIMILNGDDFSKAAHGENLIHILQRKYEQVRFDLTS